MGQAFRREQSDAFCVCHSRACLAREESRNSEGELLWCIVSVGEGWPAWEDGEDAGFLARGSHARGNDRMARRSWDHSPTLAVATSVSRMLCRG